MLTETKEYIFKNGRLLERKLFEYFFENGTKQGCINALRAYQNADGGFGNGIEPDILCPDSTAIGAETALYICDLLESQTRIINAVATWVKTNQNEDGFIVHPPPAMTNYPHHPWWENPDNDRILVLAGLLKKFGVNDQIFFKKVRDYYLKIPFPEKLGFYDYPCFVYLKYCSETKKDKEKLAKMIDLLPALLKEHADHFPLFSRYWFYAADYCEPSVLKREAETFKKAFKDGAVVTPYPDFPWWTSLFTLDGLILLKKCGIPVI